MRLNWDKASRWIAWHLPNRVVMWCFYKVTAYASQGEYGKTHVPELTAMVAVERFSKDKGLYR